jgi:hypothetical protein
MRGMAEYFEPEKKGQNAIIAVTEVLFTNKIRVSIKLKMGFPYHNSKHWFPCHDSEELNF